MKNKARILIYDLEVSPILGWTYQMYDARVFKVEQKPFIMSVSWRWYGEKKTHHLGGIMNKDDEIAIADKLWSLLDEADIVVAHNANRFDNKVANACMIRHKLTPPSSYKTVDTLRVMRSVGKFVSNSLDGMCEELGVEGKTAVKHSDIWYECLQGNKKAWKDMKDYNNQDVNALYECYETLIPWIKNHPNLGDITQIDGICPKCGSKDLNKEGTHARRAGRVQSYSCNDCGGWCNESTIKGGGRLING